MALVGDPDCLATLSRAYEMLELFFGANYQGSKICNEILLECEQNIKSNSI